MTSMGDPAMSPGSCSVDVDLSGVVPSERKTAPLSIRNASGQTVFRTAGGFPVTPVLVREFLTMISEDAASISLPPHVPVSFLSLACTTSGVLLLPEEDLGSGVERVQLLSAPEEQPPERILQELTSGAARTEEAVLAEPLRTTETRTVDLTLLVRRAPGIRLARRGEPLRTATGDTVMMEDFLQLEEAASSAPGHGQGPHTAGTWSQNRHDRGGGRTGTIVAGTWSSVVLFLSGRYVEQTRDVEEFGFGKAEWVFVVSEWLENRRPREGEEASAGGGEIVSVRTKDRRGLTLFAAAEQGGCREILDLIREKGLMKEFEDD